MGARLRLPLETCLFSESARLTVALPDLPSQMFLFISDLQTVHITNSSQEQNPFVHWRFPVMRGSFSLKHLFINPNTRPTEELRRDLYKSFESDYATQDLKIIQGAWCQRLI